MNTLNRSPLCLAASFIVLLMWTGTEISATWADDLVWGRKFQTTPSGTSLPFVLLYHRPQCRSNYLRQYFERLKAKDPNASTEVTPEVIQAINRDFQSDCTAIFELLARAGKTYEEWGLKPPGMRPIQDRNGQQYLPVILEDFGNVPKNYPKIAGRVFIPRREDGSLTDHCVLKLNVYRVCEYRREKGSIEPFLPTVAHELFHAVQWNYCPFGEPWFKESTAAWAANMVVRPKYSHVNHMNRFLLYSFLPLTFDVRDPEGGYLKLNVHGHPYGAAVWFHFLNAQRPDDSGKIVCEALKQHDNAENVSAVDALSIALGDQQPLGQRFRELHDRFAVGALLTTQAPESYRIEGIESFSELRSDLQQQFQVQPGNPWPISGEFVSYYQQSFVSPETANWQIDFEGTSASGNGTRYRLPYVAGRIGNCGTRFFELVIPEDVPESNTLDVFVPSSEEELSLQAVYQTNAGFLVAAGNFDSASGGRRLALPLKGITDRRINLVLTRYSRQEQMKAFPIRLACAEPATLRMIKITQGTDNAIVLWSQWKDGESIDGSLSNRILQSHGSLKFNPAGGPLKFEVEFTAPVRSKSESICHLGNQAVILSPNNDNRVYVGETPADRFSNSSEPVALVIDAITDLRNCKADLPLDSDPTTVADLSKDLSEWSGYDREKPMEIALQPQVVNRTLNYEGSVFNGSQLWQSGQTDEYNRKVVESKAYAFIELDTAIVGGKIKFSKEREPGSSPNALDSFEANLFSNVPYGWQLPETANGSVLLWGDANFTYKDEEGIGKSIEKFSLALYRGDDLKIQSYPEFSGHFIVVFREAKPDQETLKKVLTADPKSLPSSVMAILRPVEK